MTKTLTIEGMSCNHCKGRVERALKELDGVESAVVDLEKRPQQLRSAEMCQTASLRQL